MLKLALVLSLVLSNGDLTPHHLLKDINWRTQQDGVDLSIRSYITLSPNKLHTIQEEVKATERKFGQHYHIQCSLRHLEVRIIRSSWLNSSEYFDNIDAGYVVFGRYFGLAEVIYITPEIFANPYTLDHELAHYLFHECNMSFDNDEKEHAELERFMNGKS
jgi:hypothetical protein